MAEWDGLKCEAQCRLESKGKGKVRLVTPHNCFIAIPDPLGLDFYPEASSGLDYIGPKLFLAWPGPSGRLETLKCAGFSCVFAQTEFRTHNATFQTGDKI